MYDIAREKVFSYVNYLAMPMNLSFPIKQVDSIGLSINVSFENHIFHKLIILLYVNVAVFIIYIIYVLYANINMVLSVNEMIYFIFI